MSGFPHFSRDELQGMPRSFDPGPLFRVHKRDRPAEHFENRSIFRFDPPVDRQDEFGTFYASTSPASAFFEALGSIRPLPRSLIEERVISNLVLGGDVTLADFTAPGVFRAYGELSVTRDFSWTQNCAAELWDAGFTGVRYFPSHHQWTDEFAVALFAPPRDQDGFLKSSDPEQVSRWLLREVKDRFGINVLDSGPLPW